MPKAKALGNVQGESLKATPRVLKARFQTPALPAVRASGPEKPKTLRHHPMTLARPMFPPRAESVDLFSQPPAIGQPESGNLTSGKPAKGLSRRNMLGALAVLPAALPVAAAAAEPDPIFAAIEKHKALTISFDAAHKARGSYNDFGELAEGEKQRLRALNDAVDATGLPMEEAACELLDTKPTSPAGIVAAIRVIRAHYHREAGHMPAGEWLYEDEDDPKNGRDWLECFLDTIAEAVTEMVAPCGVRS
jgi:hypothetical protein